VSIILAAPDRAAQARRILAAYHQAVQEALARHGDAGSERALDQATLQGLRSLGYTD
jgi:hypothetical protein